jgi:chromosome segregation ATPase
MRRVLALVPLLLASACATQPCNPGADRNIFQVGGCVIGGGYQKRQDALQAQLNQATASQAEAERALAKARASRDDAATQRAELQATLAAESTRSLRLQRELASVQGSTHADQQRLQQLQAQLAEVNAELEGLRASAPSDAVRRRVASAQRRQDELNRMVQDEVERSRAAAPRD